MTENAFTSKKPLIDMHKYQVKSLSGKKGGTIRAKAMNGNAFNMNTANVLKDISDRKVQAQRGH